MCRIGWFFVFFFFFQAEDGIRDDLVTGVQTCALPISLYNASKECCMLALLRVQPHVAIAAISLSALAATSVAGLSDRKSVV